ncbi:PIR Superfamily Protein, partial [Plasmodium ovale curtisi]
MSEDIVAEALKLFEDETRKNSGLQKFYEDFYSAIKNDYKNFEGCIEENRKKKNKHDSNVFCHINHKNEIALEKFQEQFKSIRLHDTKHCDYLLYWMSDKIAECKYNTHRIIWLYNIFQKFWENGICCNKKDSENNACEKPYVIEFDLNALKSKKGLYVLLDYYNSNKNILKNETSEKKKSFCNYVKYMFKLYNNMDSDVDINVHKKYDNELSIFRSNFENEENLSELKIGCNYPNLSAQSERELNNSIMSSEGNFQRFIPFKVELSKYVIEPPSEMDDILKETSSYKLYKEFETKVEAETDNEYCKGIFKEENNHQAEGIEICKKIINNFNKLYKNEIKTSVGNPCLHYKNWVYHEIWKFVINQSEYKNAKEIIYKFLDIQKGKNLRSSNPKNVCHYYFIFSDFIELNSKKEEKDLHDYFKYYHTIYENISAHISDKEKYKKYIQYIYELYKRHKIDWKCCDASYGVDPLCRHYFKCEEEYNPSDLLEILNGAKKEDIKKK